MSVAINTDLESLLLYGGGIFDAECSSDINHAVIAVGYDLEEGYILIKNSWGESWGEDGYIRLALGLNDGDGQCGVATLASYPTVYLSSSDCNPSTKIQCSEDVSCQPDETCCCLDWNQGFCQHWECCPGNFGTCCADGKVKQLAFFSFLELSVLVLLPSSSPCLWTFSRLLHERQRCDSISKEILRNFSFQCCTTHKKIDSSQLIRNSSFHFFFLSILVRYS